MTTGQRIRDARQKAGMTQAQLAEKLGIPYQSIGQWERDVRNPKLDTLRRIAGALNITIQKLMGIPSWVDEKNIWETVDTLEQSGMTQDEIEAYLDQLEDVRSASELISDIKLYEKVRDYVLDSLVSFTPEGLLRLVDAINELKKVPDYQRLASSNEDDSEIKSAEGFQLAVRPSQPEKNVKIPPVQKDDIPPEE